MFRRIIFLALGILFFSCHNGNYSFHGTVDSIEFGVDSYTAFLRNEKGEKVMAEISRVDMGWRFKEVKIGDQITLYGDSINLGNEILIHATKINY